MTCFRRKKLNIDILKNLIFSTPWLIVERLVLSLGLKILLEAGLSVEECQRRKESSPCWEGGSLTLSDWGIWKPRKIWQVIDNLTGTLFHLGIDVRVGGWLHTLITFPHLNKRSVWVGELRETFEWRSMAALECPTYSNEKPETEETINARRNKEGPDAPLRGPMLGSWVAAWSLKGGGVAPLFS